MGAGALAIGAACLDQAQRVSERQRAVASFNTLVERVRILNSGGPGAYQVVELDLGDYAIVTEGKVVQLTRDTSILMSESLALKLISDGKITSGTYEIKLDRAEDGDFVAVVWRAPFG